LHHHLHHAVLLNGRSRASRGTGGGAARYRTAAEERGGLRPAPRGRPSRRRDRG
jgi:hypothetical protein